MGSRKANRQIGHSNLLLRDGSNLASYPSMAISVGHTRLSGSTFQLRLDTKLSVPCTKFQQSIFEDIYDREN